MAAEVKTQAYVLRENISDYPHTLNLKPPRMQSPKRCVPASERASVTKAIKFKSHELFSRKMLYSSRNSHYRILIIMCYSYFYIVGMDGAK